MIKDIKLGWKVLRYGLNLKGSIIAGVIFISLAIMWELLMPALATANATSETFMAIGALLIAQLIHSVTVSSVVQTSPYKKKLQTRVPALLGGIFILLGHTWLIGIKYLGFTLWEGMQGWSPRIPTGIVFEAIPVVLICLYMGASLKAFWPSTIVFLILFMGTTILGNLWTIRTDDEGYQALLSQPAAIAVSYVIVIAGIFAMYGIFCAMYKREYSKITFETALRRAK